MLLIVCMCVQEDRLMEEFGELRMSDPKSGYEGEEHLDFGIEHMKIYEEVG